MFNAVIDVEHGTILHVSKYHSGRLTVVENGSVANAESCKILKELSDRNVCKKSASVRHQTFQVCHLKPFLSFSFSPENFFLRWLP